MGASRIHSWMEKYGWDRNPFNFEIYPDLMIGYENEHRRVRDAIESGNKFTLLLGETGAGKTNLLRRIEDQYGGNVPLFYMSKPPVTEDGLLEYLRGEVLQQGKISRLLHSYSLYNIQEGLQKKYGNQVVLLVDEGHEASQGVLEWLRTAMDHVPSLTVVAAGLPTFEEKLQDEVGTLYNRATSVVRLNSLDRDDTIELIRRRIEYVGGSSIEPFTQDALLKIYEETGGFPRDVLRACNECVIQAADGDKSIIDASDVKTILDGESSPQVNREEIREEAEDGADDSSQGQEQDLELLTEKQRAVYDAIVELDGATSGEIVEHIGLEDYQSRDHAIRSINNMLRRLMEQELVSRKRRGRTYLYRKAD